MIYKGQSVSRDDLRHRQRAVRCLYGWQVLNKSYQKQWRLGLPYWVGSRDRSAWKQRAKLMTDAEVNRRAVPRWNSVRLHIPPRQTQ